MLKPIKIQTYTVCDKNSSSSRSRSPKKGRGKIVWRAYVNDGVELTDGDGCKTKAAAIKVCKEDRELIMLESSDGTDMGLEYYIEKERVTDNEILVLQTIPLKF